MSKFTAGRWNYLEEYIPEGITLNEKEYLIQSESREDVALVWTEANARLIAAAPEMYRLLKEVLMLKEELIPTSDCGGILSFSREMKIRAVLACIDRKEEITPHEGTD